ncbi:hypothetical protein [Duganella qianjiadongensis]|uniref:BioF2-like acetyltransferase domain-containing protein n=1 Tax=Duganella qianjiadongensis TaxID=2692176 RepID=A0ABW9VSB1_9BURK|nr:hypothetical protein [Duganella qianjiadongensis]MYM41693.1 hypothetical protein [Duganella qianjiadongensis]
MVKYRKHGLRMAELWLDSPIVRPKKCDVLTLQQYSQLPAGAISKPFSTLTINLLLSEEQLLEGLDRDTKYEVRRAASKDMVECIVETESSEEVCRAFHSFYEQFAIAKGLDRLPIEPLLARSRCGTLRFSRALLDGSTLVWHVYVMGPTTACLLHSASLFRQLDDSKSRATIGRANRLLHWRDMLAFKAEGKSIYDFGGWYAGQDNPDLLRINRFKEGFGGQRTDQVNAALALSWRGWIYLKLRQHFSAQQRRAFRAKILALVGARSA